MVVVAKWKSGLILHQLLSGHELARVNTQEEAEAHPIWVNAIDMRNFIYLLADSASGEAVAVDACWDIDGIYAHGESLGLKIIGSLYTHFHLDHT
jgi:glyoxylase-like metal-dependent hydrolase (beta-lactamase superfamily II)